MKRLIHNNKEIKFQEGNKSFLDTLNKNGITPQELPDPDFRYRVFKYEIDGAVKYACVIVVNDPEDYIERIFITDSIPEDGFYNMMLDCIGQLGGEKPTKIKSRLKVALEESSNRVQKWTEEKYPDQAFTWMVAGEYPEEIKKARMDYQQLVLCSMGYTAEIVEGLSAPDVNMDYVKSILK